MATVSIDMIERRMSRMEVIPSVPAILFPLLRYLEQPLELVNMQKIVDLISHDKSLAAQCLHMANSPLFGRWRNVDSVRTAVIALGVEKVRDIAMSCCVLKMLPKDQPVIDPRAFWEHSLGVALVSRRLARRIGFRDPEKAYLAGLLHDLGIIVNLLVIPEEFRDVSAHAFANKLPFHEAEAELIGITHCLSGAFLAEHWHLSSDALEVIRRHHDVEHASLYRGLTGIVHIADLICRSSGLGYGFNESQPIDVVGTPAWGIVAEECPMITGLGAARFASEMDMYVNEVRRLVAVLFRIEKS
jgi:putative nucleotidyltransferase with HDIG domain